MKASDRRAWNFCPDVEVPATARPPQLQLARASRERCPMGCGLLCICLTTKHREYQFACPRNAGPPQSSLTHSPCIVNATDGMPSGLCFHCPYLACAAAEALSAAWTMIAAPITSLTGVSPSGGCVYKTASKCPFRVVDACRKQDDERSGLGVGALEGSSSAASAAKIARDHQLHCGASSI